VADLITLSDYRTFQGTDPTNTLDDTRVSGMIPFASSAVLAFTERDFGATSVVESRDFVHDGSGFMDIDDASAVASVDFIYPAGPTITLDTESWTAKPGPDRFYYIELPAYAGATAGSPEMGFTRNLDVYAAERGTYGTATNVRVTATWGWPTVPDDVKLAVIWTVQSWLERPSGDLTAEAIEGWSRSWGRAGAGAASKAIPENARDLLAQYQRTEI
jgi:hypothetical protein